MNELSETERITIRLPKERVEHLQRLVDEGEFSNVSESIRAAIEAFIDERFTPDNIERVTVELPKRRALELEELVMGGESVSIDDAIRVAVSEYTENRLSKALDERR